MVADAAHSTEVNKPAMSGAARCRKYRAKRDLMFTAFPDKKQVFLARVRAQRRRCRESRGLRVRRLETVEPLELVEPIEPVEHLEPVEPVEPIEPTEPVENVPGPTNLQRPANV